MPLKGLRRKPKGWSFWGQGVSPCKFHMKYGITCYTILKNCVIMVSAITHKADIIMAQTNENFFRKPGTKIRRKIFQSTFLKCV